MDQDRSQAGPQLGDTEERTPEQVREEIERRPVLIAVAALGVGMAIGRRSSR